jgi:hypothetical protein
MAYWQAQGQIDNKGMNETMLPTSFSAFSAQSNEVAERRLNYNSWEMQRTWQLYAKRRYQGQLGRIWGVITGRSQRLYDLSAAASVHMTSARHTIGLQAVPLDRIRGSENRCHDFDRDFNPLSPHTRDRWLSIATARLRGASLPAIDLIQLGNDYFVRDGHHRVSVARALGEAYIDAHVTVWEINPRPDRSPAIDDRLLASACHC